MYMYVRWRYAPIIRSTKSSPYQDKHHSMLSSDTHPIDDGVGGWVGVAIIV